MPEITPEQVRAMLPVWHARVMAWRDLLANTAIEHGFGLASVQHDLAPIALDNADGVAFGEDDITWIEKDYDGTLDRMSAPYAILRSDDAAKAWVWEWLAYERKKRNDKALLDREAARVAAQKLEDAERAEYARLHAKYGC